MDHNEEFNGVARTMEGGNWYWISKAVIQRFAISIGPIGIAVYNVLASMADKHQECFPSQRYIADRLGYSRATINKALKLLRNQGLIQITKRNRYHLSYRLLDPRCQPLDTEMSNRRYQDVKRGNTNNNQPIRINSNIDRYRKQLSSSGSPKTNESFPQSREDLLAADLAAGLNDFNNIVHFQFLAQKYPEGLLRRTLGEARQIADERIRKSRTALFNYLLGQHFAKSRNSSRDSSQTDIILTRTPICLKRQFIPTFPNYSGWYPKNTNSKRR